MEEKMSTAAEVLESFKQQTKVVELDGKKFKIKKLSASSVLGITAIGIPYIKEAVEQWDKITDEERTKAALELATNKDYLETANREVIRLGCMEPQFCFGEPVDGMVPYEQINDELKNWLSGEILKLAGFEKSKQEFFQGSPSGEAPGSGPGGAKVQ